MVQRAAVLIAALAAVSAHADSDPQVAARKAAEAAYIQSGLAKEVRESRKGMERWARDQARLLKIEAPLVVIGAGYQIWKTRSATLRVNRTTSLTVRPTQASVTIMF